MTASALRSAAGFTSYDAAFAGVTGPAPQLVRVVDAEAHEGPVYVGDEDALYFTSVPHRHPGRVWTPRWPGAVNFTFGGPDQDVLFITTDTAVWAAVLDTKGA
ncbi:MAG TPA: hypothetical protein VK894_03510 [Jiangellales bacterium]|nr:hypothetical protein [Jiangellales bacterium]